MSDPLKNLRALIPQNFRALPPLSLGVVLLWTAAFIVLQIGYAGQLRDTRQAHEAAASLANREPVIEVDAEQMRIVRAVSPNFENDALLEFMRGNQQAGEVIALQTSFDQLASQAQTTLATHPFRTLGHVPAATTPSSYAAYFLLHAGFSHFAATLLVFLLIAPILEVLWGPTILALVMTLCIPLGAAVHSLAFPDSERALIGGSALVASLAAAVLIRFWGEEVEPLAWLSSITEIDVRVPAWSIGVLWIGYEALLWLTAQGTLPPGIDNDPGYVSHVATALFGTGFAFFIAKLGLEKRPPDQLAATPFRTSKHQAPASQRFDLSKVLAMRESGEEEEAFQILANAVEQNARNRDVVMSYWEMAIERHGAMEAAPVLKRLLREEMRRGAKTTAVRIWRQLSDHAPDFLLDPATLLGLLPMIREEEGKAGMLETLRQVIDPKNHGLTGADAAKVARWTAEIDPELATTAARRALDSLELEEKEQTELEMLAQALDPRFRGAESNKKAPPPSAFFENSDRSAFGASEDLSDLTASFPDGAITEAVPRSTESESLTIQIEGREPSVLAYSRIRAIAIVGVRGLAEKPIVIFDLLIDGRGTERPLSVIRLRCDRFDPRPLAPSAATPREALHTLLQKLLSGGNAHCLVDATSAKSGPDTLFDSLDAYHEQVLRPASGVLG